MLPWSSFWSRNYFVMHWPGIAPWLVNNFVRGAVTGLGVVNLVAAIADLLPVLVRRTEDQQGELVRLSAEDQKGGLVRRSAEREGG